VSPPRSLVRLAQRLSAPGGVARERAAKAAGDERDAAILEARRLGDDLESLVASVGVGVLRFGGDLRVEAANEVAHALLRRGAGGLVGRTVMEAFADLEAEAIVRSAHDTGSGAGEVTVGGRDGTALAIRARRSSGGTTWVVLDDLTELRRLRRIRSEFVDNISHELRTPLTNVRLLTETLARDLEEDVDLDRVRDRVGRIEVETGHLVQMVNELLDLARIEGGGAQLHVDDVELGKVVGSVVERLRTFAERQGVRLETAVAPGIPLVHGDAERLGQVLLNLVHNAVKFSPPGELVTVSVAAGGSEVVVSVADAGPGIAPADQGRIFERFYKVDRARVRGKGGTGLGLAIARHVVEAHGGRIWVESAEGRGSTFFFSLPAA
jgi:two-component system phosphate regulon sensor histidine kinase PhoR